MKNRAYMMITATIFAIVALAHAVRIVRHISVQFGTFDIPMVASWGGILVPGILSIWGFISACGKQAPE